MPTDLQARAQYLALAEFCQDVISKLWDYADGNAGLPTEALRSAQTTLLSINSGKPRGFGQGPAVALGSYEQVCTLEEVWKTPEQIEEVVQVVAQLLDTTSGAEAGARERTKKLIDAFLKLQTKALWNFEQPTPSAPPDVGELCQALARA